MVTFGTPGTSGSFSQITLGYASLDLNIICENHTEWDYPDYYPRAPTFLAVDLADPYGGTPKISLKVAEVSESSTPGIHRGTLI